MSTLFISDLHLHPSRPAIIQCFLTFLRQRRDHTEALYILGDLFEAWIGDDHPEPAYQAVKSALKSFSNAGTPLYLMHGNRDFLLSKQFAAETGCRLLPDPTRIDLYGTATVLMHGDSLCSDDEDYQRFRSKVRDPAWQRDILELPVAQRLQMAGQARQLSAQSKQGKAETIMDANQDAIRRSVEDNQADLLIHGHTHRPGIHTFRSNGREITRIVLGDWYEAGSVLAIDPQGWQLQTLSCNK
ncbi:MAG: UDP-2,3-diacylglucosamine diphosphatase [Thiogranum sp.]